MSKNPTKGMRGVSIEFAGKHRLLKFMHGPLGDFETEANAVLRPNLTSGQKLFANALMGGWLGDAKIMALALLYGLKHEDADLTIEQVNEGIDNYEGDLDDLARKIILAFNMARNPSGVASLQASWKNLDGDRKILEKAQEIRENAARMEAEASLKDAEMKMKEIQKKLSGREAPASEPSSA